MDSNTLAPKNRAHRAEPISEVISRLQQRRNGSAWGPDPLRELSTGFFDLDRMIGGLRDGNLIVVAGRPAMGTSCLVHNLAMNTALKTGRAVVCYTLSMSADALTSRMIRSLASLGWTSWSGSPTAEELQRFDEATHMLEKAPLYVVDRESVDVKQLCIEIRNLAQQTEKSGLIVVDSLDQISAVPGVNPRLEKDTLLIMRELKELAQELECPLLLTARLDRRLEEREDKRPRLGDLDYAIELEADLVLSLYRDEYYSKDSCEEPGIAEIHINKNRHGPIGSVRLEFRSSVLRFETIGPIDQA